MGLSDLSFTFDQSFSYEHFLFGSGYDDARIIEQPESRVPVTEFETVELTHEQVKNWLKLNDNTLITKFITSDLWIELSLIK